LVDVTSISKNNTKRCHTRLYIPSHGQE